MNKDSDWEDEFKKIRNSPIYFIENYFNVIHKISINLSNEEKQMYFEKYKDFSCLGDAIKEITKHYDRKTEGLKNYKNE